MAFRVETTRTAEAEALEAFAWFCEHRSFEYATEWYNGLMEALYTLGESPGRCPLAPENEMFVQEIRHLLYARNRTKYRILFTINRDLVYVLRIRHGAMQTLSPED
ncbi:MAG TPA: type II toxin-antitoxin system RelE/ParE family toxin [Chthonomonadaceae bacterium]|nr:type II toxin-antitoxin system RelE/ParE family toxin [Chthonomonadaceae bacterium]